jgi:hypothetical protein
MLNPRVLSAIWLLWDKPMVDLFATQENHKLPLYVSPIPDQRAWGVDAMSIDWNNLVGYAFPPTALLKKVLNKLELSHCRLILIAPVWPKQAWFPDLLRLSIDHPRALPPWFSLLKQTGSDIFHSDPQVYNLHAWLLSSEVTLREDFLSRQPPEWQGHRNPPHSMYTTESGKLSVLGVRNGTLILSKPLFL